MEENDKDWMMIRRVGECFFWYRLTWVVRTKGRKTIVVVVVVLLFCNIGIKLFKIAKFDPNRDFL